MKKTAVRNTAAKKPVAKKAVKKAATKKVPLPEVGRMEAIRAFYNFFKKYDQVNMTTIVSPVEGVSVKVDYQLCIYEDYMDVDWVSYVSEKVSVLARKVMDVCNMRSWEGWVENNMNSLEFESSEVKKIYAEYKTLITALKKHNFLFNDEAVEVFETSSDFKTAYSQLSLGITREVGLTDQYNAKVRNGVDHVRVGCQRVPIEAVREIIRVYDELNP